MIAAEHDKKHDYTKVVSEKLQQFDIHKLSQSANWSSVKRFVSEKAGKPTKFQ